MIFMFIEMYFFYGFVIAWDDFLSYCNPQLITFEGLKDLYFELLITLINKCTE